MDLSQLLIHIGGQIKKNRRKKNMSQAELALAWSFHKASVCRIESGQINITILTLDKITLALDVHRNTYSSDALRD